MIHATYIWTGFTSHEGFLEVENWCCLSLRCCLILVNFGLCAYRHILYILIFIFHLLPRFFMVLSFWKWQFIENFTMFKFLLIFSIQFVFLLAFYTLILVFYVNNVSFSKLGGEYYGKVQCFWTCSSLLKACLFFIGLCCNNLKNRKLSAKKCTRHLLIKFNEQWITFEHNLYVGGDA